MFTLFCLGQVSAIPTDIKVGLLISSAHPKFVILVNYDLFRQIKTCRIKSKQSLMESVGVVIA